MMRNLVTAVAASVLFVTPLASQATPVDDAVLQRIWSMGIEDSHVESIAQVLLDSLGPRLTGTPGMDRAADWAVDQLRSWGIDGRKEQYGTWIGWERGITHLDLLEPRVRSLEGTLLAWSGGTAGPVEGPVIILPRVGVAAEEEAWLASVRGSFVAISSPETSCRPDSHFSQYGTEGALERRQAERQEAAERYRSRVPSAAQLRTRLEEAGALGILQSSWTGAPGANTIHDTNVRRTPTLDLSCEDYGLLWRLAENGQGPRIRVDAQANFLGEVPVHNTLGEIRGRELPDEYVILSAHFDSWDASSGATDNGVGSAVMLEAMRILREVHPNPRRTILMALWSGEEQGLNGSRRFVAMNPHIVENVQVVLNLDTGTGRVVDISAQGFVGAGARLSTWLSRVPESITRHINLLTPDLPSAGSSDHAAFVCAGAPAFFLRSMSWSYNPLTWHTNRDSYDKLVFEDVRSNAVLLAMLAYLASEDPERVSRERREMPVNEQGQQLQWPMCVPGRDRF